VSESRTRYTVALTILVVGCAGVPSQQPSSPGTRQGAQTVAVASLVENARLDASAGRLGNAAASLERAIRLEPRNARLWQELARLRLQQRDYAQAESVALRSNSFARADPALRVENWSIIAEARERRGDAGGAQAARDSAKRID
jgi:cytochrome c-type biogenesis protein CcmH/NrfG